MIADCLKPVIGLSTSQCDCLDDVGAIDPATSLSGLYMDNLEHGIPLEVKPDCGVGSIWEALDQARSEQAEDFVTRLQMKLYEYRKPKTTPMFSAFGEKSKKGNSSRTGLKAFAGIVVKPLCQFEGMQLCLSKVHLGINAAGTYAIEVIKLDGDDSETVDFINVTVASNGYGSVDSNLSLPLSDKTGNSICYAFVYDRMSGLPRDYKFHCGCTSVPEPDWMEQKTMEVGGFSVSDPTEIDLDKCSGRYSNGLIIDFEVSCPSMEWICNVKESFWKTDIFGRVAAKTMVIGANAKFIQSILDSSNPSFYTLMGREALYGKRSHFNKLYDDLLTLLSTKLYPENLDNCIQCLDNASGFSKGEIIA